MRTFLDVAPEAVVVGIVLVIIFAVLQASFDANTLLLVAAAGALTHVAFEYTGLNQYWYERYGAQTS